MAAKKKTAESSKEDPANAPERPRRRVMPLVKNFGVVLAVILAILKIWDWFTAPADNLVANIEQSALHLPPTLDDQFASIYETLEPDALMPILADAGLLQANDDGERRDEFEAWIRRFALALQLRVPHRTPLDISMLSGTFHVDVANDGQAAVSTVRLIIPSAQLVQIEPQGEEPRIKTIDEVIELGTLQPQEALRLVVWTSRSPESVTADSIRLTHDGAIGTIVVQHDASPLAMWIDRNGIFLLAMTPLVLFVLLPAIVSLIQNAYATADVTNTPDTEVE